MMMEATPAAALEMVEPEFVLEFLIVTLDAPAQLRQAHECSEGRRRRHGREPVLRGRSLPAGPFDQQPLFRSGRRAPFIAMRWPHAQARETRAHRPAGAVAPRHPPP